MKTIDQRSENAHHFCMAYLYLDDLRNQINNLPEDCNVESLLEILQNLENEVEAINQNIGRN